MPFSYCDAWNYRARPSDYKVTNADKDFSSSVLPGVRIMKTLNKLLKTTDTPDMKVEGLYMVFVEQSRAFDWTWYPRTACTTPKLLDGTLTGAECAAFASELVKESDRRFQIANCEFINDFEIRLYIHSQFVICHLESISSHPLRLHVPGHHPASIRPRYFP